MDLDEDLTYKNVILAANELGTPLLPVSQVLKEVAHSHKKE